MIYSAVGRVLHGHHPLQVIHNLVEEVRNAVSRLRNVQIHLVQTLLVQLISHKHSANSESRIDYVFIIVASVIPSVWRLYHGASRTLRRCCRRMNLHIRIEVSSRSCILACIFLLYRHASSLQIVAFHSCHRNLFVWLLGYDHLLLVLAGSESVCASLADL